MRIIRRSDKKEINKKGQWENGVETDPSDYYEDPDTSVKINLTDDLDADVEVLLNAEGVNVEPAEYDGPYESFPGSVDIEKLIVAESFSITVTFPAVIEFPEMLVPYTGASNMGELLSKASEKLGNLVTTEYYPDSRSI